MATKTFQPDWGCELHRRAVATWCSITRRSSKPDSEHKVAAFVREHQIDMLVIDEIHHTKQRTDDISKRRRLVIAARLRRHRAQS